MNPEVLIKFADVVEKILSRINSKRLMVLYGLLLFLSVKDLNAMALYCGTGAAVLTSILYVIKPNGSDKISKEVTNGTPS